MAEPFTAIAIGLGIHLGKKVLDAFWGMLSDKGSAIATAQGVAPLGAFDAPQYVGFGFAPSSTQSPQQLVFGNLYCPDSLLLPTDAVPILLAVDERTGEAALLGAAVDEGGFQMALPPGIYSFYTFVVGLDAVDIIDAPIFAMGMPAGVDLADADEISFEGDEGAFWDLFIAEPIAIESDGPYAMDFILVSQSDVDGLPRSLGEFLEAAGEGYVDLSGEWTLLERYEFGSTEAQMYLLQLEDQLSGFVVTHDVQDDGSELLLRQAVRGQVFGNTVLIQGTGIELLAGALDEYFLDRWQGIAQPDGTVLGQSEDDAGTTGEFVMQRPWAA